MMVDESSGRAQVQLDLERLTRALESESDPARRTALYIERAGCFGVLEEETASLEDCFSALTTATTDEDIGHATTMISLILLKVGRKEEGFWWAMSAVDRASRSALVHHILGLHCSCADFVGSAIRAFHEAIDLEPDYWEVHYQLGVCLQKARRVTESVEVLKNYVNANPADPRGFFQLGQSTSLSVEIPDHIQRAMALYERAMQLDPSPRLRRRLENALMRLKTPTIKAQCRSEKEYLRPAETLRHYRMVAEPGLGNEHAKARQRADLFSDLLDSECDSKERTRLYIERARCLLILREYTKSLEDLYAALEKADLDDIRVLHLIDALDTLASLNLDRQYRMQTPKRLEQLTSAIDSESNPARLATLYLERSSCLCALGEIAKSVDDGCAALRLVETDNDIVRVMCMISLSLLQYDRKHESLWWAAAAVEHDFRSTYGQYVLGLNCSISGFDQAAIVAFTKAVDLDPTNLQARYELGKSLNATSRSTESVEVLRRYVEAQPRDPKGLFQLACSFLWSPDHNIPLAIEYCKEALRLDPTPFLRRRIDRMLSWKRQQEDIADGG